MNGLAYFFGKAIKGLHELLLLLWFTAAPVGTVELVDEWLIDIVDDGVEGEDGVLVDLSEQYLGIVGTVSGDWLARGRASHKVDTFSLKLKLLAICDEEILAGTSLLYTFTLVVDLVGLLVVDEDVRTSGSLKPSLKDWLVGNVREELRSFVFLHVKGLSNQLGHVLSSSVNHRKSKFVINN